MNEYTLLRSLIDSLPNPSFVKDTAGRYLLVNQSYAQFLGMASPAAVVGKTVFDIYPAPRAAEYHATDQAILHTGQALANQEGALTDQGGHQIHYLITKAPLRDEQGAIIGIVGISADITEPHTMVEAVRQSEARHRALLEAIPDGILRIDRNGAYLDVKAPTNFKGVRPATELVGKKQADTLPPAVAEQVMYYNNQALASGEMQVFEYDLQIDGKTHTRESRVVPVGHDEVIAIVRDITKRKQTEAENARLLATIIEQHEQLRALSKRLAEIQEAERKAIARDLHDLIGQNLTALGLTLKLMQTQLPAALTTSQQIKLQLQDAISLVTQTTSAIRNMMTELRPPVLDDYGLLAALRWYSNQVATRTGLKIDVYGDGAQPRLPEEIENALFRIAQEALTNVVKHAHATQVMVMLVITDDSVALQITDNGRGFAPNILTPITRLGWGLLNMRERAEAIGGCCESHSRPDAGVTVLVEVSR